MSMRALLLATKSTLQSALSLNDYSCDIGFDGLPKPSCGQEYIAIHPGQLDNAEIDWGLDESYGVIVTLTHRVPYAPQDKWGTTILTTATTGLVDRAARIRAVLHQSLTVMAAANVLITASYNGFVEPYRFRGGSTPELKGPDWFSAEEAEGNLINAGVAVTLSFSGARRLQTIESMG